MPRPEGAPSQQRQFTRRQALRLGGVGVAVGAASLVSVELFLNRSRSVEPKPVPSSLLPSPSETVRPSSGLITIEKGQFFRDGKPFGFFGTNNFALLTTPDDSAYYTPQMTHADRAAYIADIRSKHMNIVRTMAYPVLDDYSKHLGAFKDVLNLAGDDIVVYPTLENEWTNGNGANKDKDPEWFREGYKETYRPYVLSLVKEFKGDPRIFAFQLMNEAQCDDAQALYEFTKDLITAIKDIDPQRLVTLGTIGSGQPGTDNDNYNKLMELCDFGDGHLYPGNGTEQALSNDFEVLAAQRKPFMLGEWGIDAAHPDISDNTRIMNSALRQPNFGGVIMWEYEDAAFNRNVPGTTDDQYPIREKSAAFTFFESYADKLKHPALRPHSR